MSFFRFLDLPNELKCLILGLCDPDDFESVVLASKKLHELAKQAPRLIQNHNLCKHFALLNGSNFSTHGPTFGYNGLSWKRTGHLIIRRPAQFLIWLSQKPPEIQVQLFRYFKRLILFPSVMEEPPELCDNTLQQCPSLNRAVLDAQRITKSGHGTACPGYENALLIIFSQVQSLVLPYANHLMNYKCYGSQSPGLPELASGVQGIKYFQNLRELYLHGTLFESHHATIAPLLGLPRLETLILGAFDHQDRPAQERGISYDRYRELCDQRDLVLHEPAGDQRSLGSTLDHLESHAEEGHCNIYSSKCSSLKKLVILRGWWHSEDMAKLLRHVPDLCSFIWVYRTFRLRYTMWGDHFHRVFVDKLFNPLSLLQQLSSTHRDKLEHLALLIDDTENLDIPRDNRIIHFKDFIQLKHLEFDTRLLRLDKDMGTYPLSLTEVIPPNLQNLGLVIEDPDDKTMDALLNELSVSKASFPSLQKIGLCVLRRGGAPMQLGDEAFHVWHLVFGMMGVTFVHKYFYYGGSERAPKPTFDWSGQLNIFDHIQEAFFQTA